MAHRPWRLPLALAGGLLLASSALAEPYIVETVGHTQRSEAEAARALALAEGLEAQGVRSFRKGRGWVFLVRIQDVQDRDTAAATAQRLADLTGKSVQVFLVAGKDTLPVEELAVAAAGSVEPPVPSATSSGDQAVADERTARAEGSRLLAAMVLAHGGGGAVDEPQPQLVALEPVHFRFERSADIGGESLRVWHDYWRVGDQLRLEVRILEGEGTDSVTIVRGEQAWLAVGGELHEVASGPTREALALFDPAVVLERAAEFATWSSELRVRQVERSTGGSDLTWLALDSDGLAEAVLVGIDSTDQRARELVMVADSAELCWTFADYQEVVDGLVVPLRLESSFDGQPREQVTVRTLELPEHPDASWFDPELLEKP